MFRRLLIYLRDGERGLRKNVAGEIAAGIKMNDYTYMNKRLIYRVLLIGLFFAMHSAFSQAQEIKATATLDTNRIMIGDQVKLQIQIEHPAKHKVRFPALPDTINKIEVLERSKIDTVPSTDPSRITERQTYIITSFDSGHFPLSPLKFVLEADTNMFFETEALLLSVYAPKVDTTQAIKEIKGPLDVPFSIREAIPYIVGGGILLAILIGLYYYFKNRKKKPGQIEIKVPSRPAHEIALEALKELENEKVWQTQENGVKSYHSAISDIIRTYIEHRYKIPAMELTTDEILNNFRRTSMKEEPKEKLRQLLQLSDLVKFAKAQPLPNEHELSLSSAYDFVSSTIPQPVKRKEGKEEAQ